MTASLVPTSAESGSDDESPQQIYVRMIHKMLKDEHRSQFEPTMNSAMLTVLNDDAALGVFASYITRVQGHDVEREPILDGPREVSVATSPPNTTRVVSDEVTPELVASYRATMLLTGDEASEAVVGFLKKKAKLLVKCLFPIFQANAHGDLRHGCRVLDHLLRHALDDVYEVLGRTPGTVKRYMGAMLPHLEHAPVAEAFLTLICKPHNAALMRYYAVTPQKKWQFFRALSEWKVLLVLAEHVHGARYTEAHNVAAADVFLELLDRLSADDNGALLLQPVAFCPELLEGLLDTAVDPSATRSQGQRTAAMRCVLRLLQRSADQRVQGPPTSPYQSFGSTVVNLVPNQLEPLRHQIFQLGMKNMDKMLQYLIQRYRDQQNIEMDLSSDKPLPEGAVRHTAYVVKVPFTEFRLTLVDAIVELVSYNPDLLGKHFDAEVWRVLVTWFFEYAHNNLYHAAFYHLVFIALRNDNHAALEVLVKKLKLISLLVEHYRNDSVCTSNKGYILQCCNAIRLQAASQPPDAFLRNFLQSHIVWRSFEPELRELTTKICDHGLGFNVPQPMRPGSYLQKDTWQLMDEERGIDHGSEFAKSLGFFDDVAWPDEPLGNESSKKKKKKKKGKKKAASENGTEGDDHDDEHTEGSVAASEDSEVTEDGHTDEHDGEDADHHSTAQSNGDGSGKKNKKKKKKNKGKK